MTDQPRNIGSTPAAQQEVTVRPFAHFLVQQSKGRSHEELSEGLHDLIAKCVETGKKGTLTYTVEVVPLDREGENVRVNDDIKLRLPQHDRPGQTYYLTKDGNLTKADPNQPQIEGLKGLPPVDGPQVNYTTGEVAQ